MQSRAPRVKLPLAAASVAAALAAAACGGASEVPAPASQAESEAARADVLRVSTVGWKTDFSKHTVPLEEFQSGGPGKDGIPAIDEPGFVTVDAAHDWMKGREPVIEVALDADARAYPIQILVWHEIVNDEIAGIPVSVTFCPLCNTALAFDRRVAGRVLSFGTTGNLRNSDLVMYDRETETWWQQFGGEAVVGELAGTRLDAVPARIVAFADFARRHADGRVLSRETGFGRPYGENPYVGYDDVDSSPLFGAANDSDRRLAPKDRVVFVERGGEAVVIPFSLLEQRGSLEVDVGSERLTVEWIPDVGSPLDEASVAGGRTVGAAVVRDRTGAPVVFDTPFWFAVAAFRPDVRIVLG